MGERVQVTVLMSGGIDSAACAAFLAGRGMRVSALFVDYGQLARDHEASAVAQLAEALQIKVRTAVFRGDRRLGAGELIGRNAFLLFSALFTTELSTGVLALGLHAGTPYFDCSQSFVDLIDRVVLEHTDGRVKVLAPFIQWSKRDVYEFFVQAGLPIAATYSCEQGTLPVCGLCASCRDRKALGC